MKNKNQINEENKVTETVDGKIELEKIVSVVNGINASEVLLNQQVNDATSQADENSTSANSNEEKSLIKCDDVYMKADLPNGGEPTAEEIEEAKKKKKKRNILMAIFIPVGVIVLVVVIIIGIMLNMPKGEAPKVSLNENSIILREGQTKQLKLLSDVDTKDFTLTWASKNVEIATIDNTGLVTAVKEGDTKVSLTITGSDLIKDPLTCLVKVDNQAAGLLVESFVATKEGSQLGSHIWFYDDNTYRFFCDSYVAPGAFAAMGNLTMWVGECKYDTEVYNTTIQGNPCTGGPYNGTTIDDVSNESYDNKRDNWSLDENKHLKLANAVGIYMPSIIANYEKCWKATLVSEVVHDASTDSVIIKIKADNGQVVLEPAPFTLNKGQYTKLGVVL